MGFRELGQLNNLNQLVFVFCVIHVGFFILGSDLYIVDTYFDSLLIDR